MRFSIRQAARASYHHGDLRSALIAAGRLALRTGTVESLSLRELSRSVGVTPAAAYRHFRDKELLLEALALEGFEELRAMLHRAGAERGGRTAAAAAFGAYRGFARREPSLFQLMFRARPKGRGSNSRRDEAMGACLAEFVALHTTTESVDDPEEAIREAVGLWSSLHGLVSLGEVGAFAALDPWMLPTADALLSRKRRGRP